MKYRPFKQELRDSNLIRYKGTPPPRSLIQKILINANLSKNSFELIYAIPDKTLERYISGKRGMPAYYWHIFYEFNNLEKFYRNFKTKKKKKAKEAIQKATPIIAQTNKSLIDAIRARINK